MRWSAAQLAAAAGGVADRHEPPGPPPGGAVAGAPASWEPIGIDSRSAAPGSVFVPVVAARDGHDFVAGAVAAGARAYLYEPARLGGERPEGAVGIAVADTSAALLDVGRAARRRLSATVVGITGSVGKTSTKDLCAAAVGTRLRVTASTGSFNNELGVPLTLANAAEDTEVAVIEMGARGRGHIALLCDVAHPDVAVVTAVAAVHTEMFGDLRGVAEAKGELVEALPAGGTAVLNGDDPLVSAMGRLTEARVLRYAVAATTSPPPGADVVAEGVTLDDGLQPRFSFRSPWGHAEVRLAARGAHQVGNALAALSVACLCGVPVEEAAGGVGRAGISRWRMELGTSPAGAKILNDAYNANPASVEAALRSLARIPARRRVAVLGTMAELGPSGPAEHRRMAAVAAELGIEVIAVGTADYGPEPAGGVEDALRALGPVGEGDAVLVKASRVAGLERMAARLLAG